MPKSTEEQVQAARDRHALRLAQAWGFDPDSPDTLATAIERLRKAARPDPADVYRERSDPNDQRRRRERLSLAETLEDIQQRQGQPSSVPGESPC